MDLYMHAKLCIHYVRSKFRRKFKQLRDLEEFKTNTYVETFATYFVHLIKY